jgi:hypothetical protein
MADVKMKLCTKPLTILYNHPCIHVKYSNDPAEVMAAHSKTGGLFRLRTVFKTLNPRHVPTPVPHQSKSVASLTATRDGTSSLKISLLFSSSLLVAGCPAHFV